MATLGDILEAETRVLEELTDADMATMMGGLTGWRLTVCIVGIAGASLALMAFGAVSGGAGWAILGAYFPMAMAACGI